MTIEARVKPTDVNRIVDDTGDIHHVDEYVSAHKCTAIEDVQTQLCVIGMEKLQKAHQGFTASEANLITYLWPILPSTPVFLSSPAEK